VIIGLETRGRRISRWVIERLTGGGVRDARVASVHTRVAIFRLDSGELVCVGATTVPLAANGLSIDLPPAAGLGALGLEAGQAATLSRRSLSIPAAGLCVDLAGASRWEPRPRPGRTSPRELAHRARRARALTVAEGSSPSLLPLLWVSAGAAGLLPEPARSAAPAAAVLGAVAARAEPDGVRRAAARLAGLGPGLTPSGDDYLAGFAAAWVLAAAALGRRGPAGAAVPDALVRGAAPGASPLGRAWIAHAARGEVAEPIARFLTALLGGAPEALAGSTRGVLGVGASSGTDWMVGALSGVDALLAAIAPVARWN
jgi:Protein of unknown function (DUF2877)